MKFRPIRLTAALALVCSVGLLLTACGGAAPKAEQQPPADAVPAPEPVPAQTMGENPFSSYFNLEGLPGETLSACSQKIQEESKLPDGTIRVRQALGDARSLYVAFDVIDPVLPENDTEAAPPSLSVSLEESGGTTLPSPESQEVNLTQIDEHTISVVAAFRWEQNRQIHQDLTLMVRLSPASADLHQITWTDKTNTELKTAALTKNGTEAGTVSLSPLGAYISGVPSEESSDTITLLDAEEQPAEPNAALNGTHDQQTVFMFYTPLDITSISQLTYGEYTAVFPAS